MQYTWLFDGHVIIPMSMSTTESVSPTLSNRALSQFTCSSQRFAAIYGSFVDCWCHSELAISRITDWKCWYECPTFRFEANNLWESLHGLTNRSTWIMQIEPESGQHPSQWRHGSSWNIQLLFLRTWMTRGFCWGRHWSAVNYLMSASCTPHWFRSTRPLMHGR